MAPVTRCIHAPGPAPARLFVRLSLRLSAGSGPVILDDVLVARRIPPRPCRLTSFAPPAAAPGPTRPRTSLGQRLGRPSPAPSRSFFGTTARCSATRAVFNPRPDDGGSEMIVEITPRAAKRLAEIMVKDRDPGLALRVQVESGGCHGFQYIISLQTLPPPPYPEAVATAASPDVEPVVREDDTIFGYVATDEGAVAAAADEATSSSSGDNHAHPTAKIIMDRSSLELLKGSKVDFTEELIGSQFKIIDNPMATSSCGCGTSFDIKF